MTQPLDDRQIEEITATARRAYDSDGDADIADYVPKLLTLVRQLKKERDEARAEVKREGNLAGQWELRYDDAQVEIAKLKANRELILESNERTLSQFHALELDADELRNQLAAVQQENEELHKTLLVHALAKESLL